MRMLHQLHLAAQYLAMAGKSFLEHRDDDSHTNLGFSTEEKSLFSRPLNDSGVHLALNYSKFSLDWKSRNPQSMELHGKTHEEVVLWISERAEEEGIESPYRYQLHYQLPYTIDANRMFELTDEKEILELVHVRTLAQSVLTSFLEQEKLSSEVRVWPHHFDTGGFAHLHDGSGKSIGVGLAVPDHIVDDFYFYISAYRGNAILNTWAFKPISNGKWVDNGFKGAVMAASKSNEATVLQFFNEALGIYKNLGS